MSIVTTTKREFKIKESLSDLIDEDGYLLVTELLSKKTSVKDENHPYTKFVDVPIGTGEKKVLLNKDFIIEIKEE